MNKALQFIIGLYQRCLSPFLGRNCRFYPSCSEYSKGCLEQHGLARGMLLSVRRLVKCHPLHGGGFDPVPPPKKPKD